MFVSAVSSTGFKMYQVRGNVVSILVSLCIYCASASPATRTNFTTQHLANCVEAGHQKSIYVSEILGLWSVIEVIEHSERYTDRRNYLRTPANSGSCPVVHFSTHNEREVRMLWNEEKGYILFDFRMTNINNPGFWISMGWQTGTLVDNSYEHFAGTVQVMKAVQTHMVLTFCSPQDRHFSVILARKQYLSHDEVRGVHKQLNRINLPLVNIQNYCRNSALLTVSSLSYVLAAVLLSCRHLFSSE